MAAPICHVSTDEKIEQPAPAKLPSIPLANDLPSAIAAINAMRQMLMLMTGQNTPSGGLARPGSAGGPNSGASPKQQKIGRWQEVSRTTETVKIPIKDDANEVEVQRINSFTMRDTVTGEIFSWKR